VSPHNLERVIRPLILLSCLASPPALAGQSSTPPSAESPPIEDNSFLIEEAYNQGQGIVQHVSTFERPVNGSGWVYAFAQEWPLGGRTHQLSYSIPFARTGDPEDGATGIGDVEINYRYQVGGLDRKGLALAPSFTVALPTGASSRALGAGGLGFAFNLPFSAELPGPFVAHSNAGGSYTPRARDTFGDTAPINSYGLGQSIIWLAHSRFHPMIESTWTVSREVSGPGQTRRTTELLISPGFRGAFDFSSGLQVVPGIAFPFGVGASRGERAVFVYLSFEHPFSKRAP